jgi:hypothetical protein
LSIPNFGFHKRKVKREVGGRMRRKRRNFSKNLYWFFGRENACFMAGLIS